MRIQMLFLSAVSSVVLFACVDTAGSIAVRSLTDVSAECSLSKQFSLMCQAVAKSGVAARIDEDATNYFDRSTLYVAFFPSDRAVRANLASKGLSEAQWLASDALKDFVKAHFVKGPTPWNDATTNAQQPPLKFELTALNGSKIQVNWVSTSGTMAVLNDNVNLNVPSTFAYDLIPPGRTYWKFNNLFVYGIEQVLQ
jgi:Fasciclin domain